VLEAGVGEAGPRFAPGDAVRGFDEAAAPLASRALPVAQTDVRQQQQQQAQQ